LTKKEKKTYPLYMIYI